MKKAIVAVCTVVAVAFGIFMWRGQERAESTTTVSQPPKALTSTTGVPSRGSSTTLRGSLPAVPVASWSPAAQPPLPPVQTPLVNILGELKRRAAAGDAGAACRLGFEFNRCRTYLPIYQRHAGKARKEAEAIEAKSPGSAEARQSMRWAERMEREAANGQLVCAGLPEQETKEAFYYATMAAEAGQPEAMVRWLTFPPGLDIQRPMKTAEGWVEYKERAPALFQRALASGNPAAFELAAHAYARPLFSSYDLVPKDPIMAAAYWMALRGVSSAGYATVIDNNLRYLAQKENLTEADLAKAAAKAQELSTQIRSPKSGPIDYSEGTFGSDDGRHCEG